MKVVDHWNACLIRGLTRRDSCVASPQGQIVATGSMDSTAKARDIRHSWYLANVECVCCVVALGRRAWRGALHSDGAHGLTLHPPSNNVPLPHDLMMSLHNDVSP
jgi:hypothetical protein